MEELPDPTLVSAARPASGVRVWAHDHSVRKSSCQGWKLRSRSEAGWQCLREAQTWGDSSLGRSAFLELRERWKRPQRMFGGDEWATHLGRDGTLPFCL